MALEFFDNIPADESIVLVGIFFFFFIPLYSLLAQTQSIKATL